MKFPKWKKPDLGALKNRLKETVDNISLPDTDAIKEKWGEVTDGIDLPDMDEIKQKVADLDITHKVSATIDSIEMPDLKAWKDKVVPSKMMERISQKPDLSFIDLAMAKGKAWQADVAEKFSAIEMPDISEYASQFSESDFVKKIKSVASAVGEKFVYVALLLFYSLISDHTSLREKGMILAGLGYFIAPLDMIPDAIPLTGFGDDLTALTFILDKLWFSLPDSVKLQADETIDKWFHQTDESSTDNPKDNICEQQELEEQ